MCKLYTLTSRSLSILAFLLILINFKSIFPQQPETDIIDKPKLELNLPNGVTLISYDFKSDHLDNPRTVDYNAIVGFQIKNINTFLYNITVTPTQKTFHEEQSDLFKGAFGKKLTMPETPAAEKSGQEIVKLNDDSSRTVVLCASDPIKGSYLDVVKAVEDLDKIQIFYDNLTLLVQSEELDAQQIIQGKYAALSGLFESAFTEKYLDPGNYENISRLYNYFNSLPKNYDKAVEEFEQTVKEKKKQLMKWLKRWKIQWLHTGRIAPDIMIKRKYWRIVKSR